MEPLGRCIGKFPDGRKCENPVPGTQATYVALNAQAFAPLLCPACKDRMRTLFLAGAEVAQWRKYPPTEAPDGRLVETTYVRRVLRAAGSEVVAKHSGPLRNDALMQFIWLYGEFPDLLDRVRREEIFSPEELAKINGRVVENRGHDAEEPEPVE